MINGWVDNAFGCIRRIVPENVGSTIVVSKVLPLMLRFRCGTRHDGMSPVFACPHLWTWALCCAMFARQWDDRWTIQWTWHKLVCKTSGSRNLQQFAELIMIDGIVIVVCLHTFVRSTIDTTLAFFSHFPQYVRACLYYNLSMIFSRTHTKPRASVIINHFSCGFVICVDTVEVRCKHSLKFTLAFMWAHLHLGIHHVAWLLMTFLSACAVHLFTAWMRFSVFWRCISPDDEHMNSMVFKCKASRPDRNNQPFFVHEMGTLMQRLLNYTYSYKFVILR